MIIRSIFTGFMAVMRRLLASKSTRLIGLPFIIHLPCGKEPFRPVERHPKHGASLGKGMWNQIWTHIGKSPNAAGRREANTSVFADEDGVPVRGDEV